MEHKRILTIQDISCVGQCSGTVALPILSAWGHETCILPTALLSTHTGGFGTPKIIQLADQMEGIRQHWESQNITFDAIYTGYLGSVEAISQAETLTDTLLKPGGLFIADPAMADHGKLYSGLSESYASAMGRLLHKADLILPNITEAAMLTGMPYRKILTEDYVAELLEKLHHPCVVLTGVGFQADETGAAILDRGNRFDYRHRKFPRNCFGTGDLFASCLTGAYLSGKSLKDAAKIAADTVYLSIQATEESHTYGVRFETVIGEMLKMR